MVMIIGILTLIQIISLGGTSTQGFVHFKSSFRDKLALKDKTDRTHVIRGSKKVP